MAPKSDASKQAKLLKDAGKTRHEARWELQQLYGTTISKSRLSQLLAENWNDPAVANQRPAQLADTAKTMATMSNIVGKSNVESATQKIKSEGSKKRKADDKAMKEDKDDSKMNNKDDGEESNSSAMRHRKRLRSKRKCDY